jgi:hypothetical protein
MGIYPTIKGFVLMGHAQIYCHALMEMIFLPREFWGSLLDKPMLSCFPSHFMHKAAEPHQ